MTDPASLHRTTMGDEGSPIVFCHGLFGQGRNWTQIGKALADHHRVTLVDLPHHGRSPWAPTFDFFAMADSVAALLSPDDPVTLVGHSMGGKVAMLVALRHPELVARLCVVDVSPVDYGAGTDFAAYIRAMQAMDLATVERREDADAALAEAVPSSTVRGFLLQNLRREGDGWRWQVNLDVLGAELPKVSGWPEAELDGTPPYDGPVLWVAGGRSAYIREEYAAAMDRWFPRTRRVVVRDAGHWVHSEQPGVFVDVLRRFVD